MYINYKNEISLNTNGSTNPKLLEYTLELRDIILYEELLLNPFC